jgi:hypothetical protein
MNKTLIFKTYSDFLNREDFDTNGVGEAFALANPNFKKENETNKSCWNCSGCSGCSRCSGCSDCSGCSGCSRCSGCSDCSDCSGCSRCSGCSDCSGLKNAALVQNTKEAGFKVPVIENIHQKVYEAASKEGALDMSSWHSCETTHCRAGWAVFLAGEAGKKLENQTSTLFAAMQIYKASSEIRVYPPSFFVANKLAMEDMRACAQMENERTNK